MIARTPEPELMEDVKQAIAYANADFMTSNNLFVDYIAKNMSSKMMNVLDIGCGPADVPLLLAKKYSNISITAIDGSAEMVKIAQQRVHSQKLGKQIKIKQAIIPGLDIKNKKIDLILSKDMLHHIPDAEVFWKEIKRLASNTTVIYVMDLIRPDSTDIAREIIDKYAYNESQILKEDFYNSLLASYTLDEIKDQLEQSGFIYKLEQLGDRHFIVKAN